MLQATLPQPGGRVASWPGRGGKQPGCPSSTSLLCTKYTGDHNGYENQDPWRACSIYLSTSHGQRAACGSVGRSPPQRTFQMARRPSTVKPRAPSGVSRKRSTPSPSVSTSAAISPRSMRGGHDWGACNPGSAPVRMPLTTSYSRAHAHMHAPLKPPGQYHLCHLQAAPGPRSCCCSWCSAVGVLATRPPAWSRAQAGVPHHGQCCRWVHTRLSIPGPHQVYQLASTSRRRTRAAAASCLGCPLGCPAGSDSTSVVAISYMLPRPFHGSHAACARATGDARYGACGVQTMGTPECHPRAPGRGHMQGTPRRHTAWPCKPGLSRCGLVIGGPAHAAHLRTRADTSKTGGAHCSAPPQEGAVLQCKKVRRLAAQMGGTCPVC